jgi:D-beta-D-heptose 7-phosphate kinase/D-beta-D-heptose 1-phosphate adenosyltransferase
MDILEAFKDVKVLVVGDVMLDRYWWGDVTRISPEAPVPVVRLKNSTLAAGGAANVAANVAGLGGTAILLGCVGNDPEADLFCSLFRGLNVDAGHIVRLDDRPTIVKTRVIAHSQQVARIDQETVSGLSDESEQRVIEQLLALIDDVDVIAVSDYAKGLLTQPVLSKIFAEAKRREKPVLVDPKGKDYAKYRGATIVTPNRREAAEACNMDDNGAFHVVSAGQRLLGEYNFEAVLITEGEHGMTLFRCGREPVQMKALAREVYDVTGAGDTVIAALGTAVGAGVDLERAARIANIAAGIVVEQVGTTTVTADELQSALDKIEQD